MAAVLYGDHLGRELGIAPADALERADLVDLPQRRASPQDELLVLAGLLLGAVDHLDEEGQQRMVPADNDLVRRVEGGELVPAHRRLRWRSL